MPIGVVTDWHGALIDIPAGWFVCDGTNGTPDLRDKFIVGAGPTYPADSVGGSVQHQHDATAGISAADAGPVGAWDVVSPSSIEDNLPPYYAMVKIKHVN